MNPILDIIIRSAAVYFFMMIALRLTGKKQLSQLNTTDVILILLISNAVQNAMVGPDTTLLGGLIAASVLFAINMIFKKLKFKFPGFKKLVEGEPVILIYKGVIKHQNCEKNGITEDELLQAIREHGSSEIEDIDSLILEADGNISVVSNNHKNHSIRKIKHRKVN